MVLATNHAAGQTITAADINAIATDVNTNTTATGNNATAILARQLPLVRTAVKTANYTAVAQDLVPVDTTSTAVTVTLPTAPADGTRVAVKHIIQGSTNAVTVTRGGTDVFNKASGSTSLSLPLVNQSLIVQYQTSTGIWTVLDGDIPLSGLDARFLAIGDASVTNARTPTAHASTHVLGGSDQIAGVGKPLRVTSDVTVSSTTFIDVTGLVTGTLAAGTYEVLMHGAYSSSSTSSGLFLKHTFDGTLTAYNQQGGFNTSGSGTNSVNVATSTLGTSLGSSSANVAGTVYGFTLSGTIVVSVAGVLKVQFAASSGTPTITLKAGTTLKVTPF